MQYKPAGRIIDTLLATRKSCEQVFNPRNYTLNKLILQRSTDTPAESDPSQNGRELATAEQKNSEKEKTIATNKNCPIHYGCINYLERILMQNKFPVSL